jgi:predicted ArsR family transcriptional regulator
MAESGGTAGDAELDLSNIPEFWREFIRMWGYDPETAHYRVLFVFRSASDVLRGLLDDVGPAETLEAIRPFGNIYGRNIADIARQMGTAPGDDLVSVTMPYYFGVYCSSGGDIKPMEIRDGKAVVELFACPTMEVQSPTEVCAMSHFNAEGVCQAINPDYEYVFTHHLNNGDDRCRFIVKKRSAKMKAVGPEPSTLPFLSMFKTPMDIENEQLGRLERTIPFTAPQVIIDLTSLTIAATYFNMFTAASVARIGSQRTMERSRAQAIRAGMEIGAECRRTTKGHDLDLMREKLGYIHTVLNQKGEPATITSSGLEREVVDCPMKGALPEQCAYLEGVFNGICQGIDPDYEFAYDRMMCRGDRSCHWAVRRRAQGRIEIDGSKQEDQFVY